MRRLILSIITAVALLSAAFLLPEIIYYASADSNSQMGVKLGVNEVVSVASNKASIDINADLNQFGSSSASFTASTNGRGGYTVTMSTASAETALKHSSASISDKIDPVSGNSITSSNFPAGKWGYTGGRDNCASFYCPVPSASSATSIATTDAPSTNTHTLTFGAKPGQDSTSGNYNNTVIVSITPNADPFGTFQLTYKEGTTDTVTGMPIPAIIFCEGIGSCDITVTDATPVRAGYEFLGWSTTEGAATAEYTSGDVYTATTASSNLYAVYEQNLPVYTITLDKQTGTGGTSSIYEKYSDGFYLDSAGTSQKMSTSANPITKPTKTYTISYNANSQGATYDTTGKTSSSATFNGYYDSAATTGGVQYINDNGYLASNASSTKFSANGTLYARWTDNTMELPEITKSGYTCQWAAGSPAGTKYDSSATVTISADTTYYAVCTSSGPTTMQEMTPEYCTSMATNATLQLKDSRDNKLYWVTKLPDNNCWMTQNLAFNLTAGTNLTSAATDLNEKTTWTVPTTSETASTLTDWTCSSDTDCAVAKSYSYGDTTYGNYYSWYAATANSGKYTTAAGVIPADSICPKGWRLPNIDEYNVLGIADTSMAIGTPYSFILGGYVESGYGMGGPSDYGVYITSSIASTSSRLAVWKINASGAPSTNNYEKDDGLNIRCIAHRAITNPTITYNANGGTGSPSSTTAPIASEYPQTITLSSVTPTKSGKYFSSWNTKSDGTGTWYSPSSTITTASSVTLYAIYGGTFDEAFAEAGKSKQSGYYKMQDMTNSICTSVGTNQTTTLIDTRDSNTYNIVKLSTNQCWMQQNLRIGKSGTSYTLNSTNSDLPSDTTFTLASAQTSGTTSWSCSSDSACKTSRVYVTGNTSYGNYYSWYTATGNTGTYSMSSGNATGSICPKGWRLPIGGESGDFTTLNNIYNSGSTSSHTGLMAAPLSFVFAGLYDGGAKSQNTEAIYWASNTISNVNAGRLRSVNGLSAAPAAYGSKYIGSSVRCISR